MPSNGLLAAETRRSRPVAVRFSKRASHDSLAGHRFGNAREVRVFTVSGICVDSWVRVEGHCGITCDVVGDEAEFRFGGACSTGLHMIVTEEGLEKLVHTSIDALHRMRTELDDHERAESQTA